MHPNLFLEAIRIWADHYGRAFLKLTETPIMVQRRTLLSKIRRNQDSDFGRKHDFDRIRTVEDFRKAMPVTDYAYVDPYVQRVIAGDVGALFGPGARIIMFALTSGTDGKPKHIPVTAEFLEEYKRSWRVWGSQAHRDHPRAFGHRILQISSAWNEYYTEKGIPCGSISGLNAAMQPWVIRQMYLPGRAVHLVKDPGAKAYLVARISMARKVSLIISANPSSVLTVARAIAERGEQLVRDIHDGGIGEGFDVTRSVRQELRRRLRPDHAAARRLSEALRRNGSLRPTDCWPELGLVANWMGGTVQLYLEEYPRHFPGLPVREIGLLASEGRLTITVSDGPGGVLDIGSHFFEFVPEEELENPQPQTLTAGELEVGRHYGMVVTTSSGLYRYNIRDVVLVEGFYGRTPVVSFLNKGNHIASMTGEKLTEHQVVEALKRISKRTPACPERLLVNPAWAQTPHYSVTVEARPDDTVEWGEFIRLLDQELEGLNLEYRAKRQSGRLGDPVLSVVPEGTFDRLKEEHLARVGGRREQYKHVFLIPEIDYHRRFEVIRTVPGEPSPARPVGK